MLVTLGSTASAPGPFDGVQNLGKEPSQDFGHKVGWAPPPYLGIEIRTGSEVKPLPQDDLQE